MKAKITKGNIKVFTIVSALILASALMLTGAIYVLAASTTDEKSLKGGDFDPVGNNSNDASAEKYSTVYISGISDYSPLSSWGCTAYIIGDDGLRDAVIEAVKGFEFETAEPIAEHYDEFNDETRCDPTAIQICFRSEDVGEGENDGYLITESGLVTVMRYSYDEGEPSTLSRVTFLTYRVTDETFDYDVFKRALDSKLAESDRYEGSDMMISRRGGDASEAESGLLVVTKEYEKKILAAKEGFIIENIEPTELDISTLLDISPSIYMSSLWSNFAVDANGLILFGSDSGFSSDSVTATKRVSAETFDYDLFEKAYESRVVWKDEQVNAPTPRSEMSSRFDSMNEVSGNEDGTRTITVMTDAAFESYWGNPAALDRKIYKSLSAEEVLFIIDDSVRIYNEYDKIVLNDYKTPLFSSYSYAADLPVFDTETVIYPISYTENTAFAGGDSGTDAGASEPEALELKPATASAYYKIIKDIYSIIVYRIRALSTDDCYISFDEAYKYVRGEEYIYIDGSGRADYELVYVPSYSEETDREFLYELIGGEKSFTDLEKWVDLFEMTPDQTTEAFQMTAAISFSSLDGTEDVYPTASLKALYDRSDSLTFFFEGGKSGRYNETKFTDKLGYSFRYDSTSDSRYDLNTAFERGSGESWTYGKTPENEEPVYKTYMFVRMTDKDGHLGKTDGQGDEYRSILSSADGSYKVTAYDADEGYLEITFTSSDGTVAETARFSTLDFTPLSALDENYFKLA